MPQVLVYYYKNQLNTLFMLISFICWLFYLLILSLMHPLHSPYLFSYFGFLHYQHAKATTFLTFLGAYSKILSSSTLVYLIYFLIFGSSLYLIITVHITLSGWNLESSSGNHLLSSVKQIKLTNSKGLLLIGYSDSKRDFRFLSNEIFGS